MLRRAMLTAAILCGVASAPALAQCDTSFTLANRSNAVVNEVYFNPTRLTNWGPDRLGQNVLAPGSSVNFRPSPGGNYDFKIVFANGRELERRGVDLCSVSTVTVSGSGIAVQ